MGTLTKAGAIEIAHNEDDNHQYLVFSLGGETYAIAILRIKEIISYGQLTTVPMMPSFIRGVINLRGSVVPVVDMKARFGAETTQVQRRTCIVIIEAAESNGEAQDVGVMVDAVNEVVEIPEDQVEPAPTFGARIRSDFIRGMGKLNDEFVIILNLDSVLAIDELADVSIPRLDAPPESMALPPPHAGA